MEWILGSIALVGIAIGVYAFLKRHQRYGAVCTALALLCPLLTAAVCSLKHTRAYGGTNFEFLVHSAFVDGDPCPWILLILWGAEVICILKATSKMLK